MAIVTELVWILDFKQILLLLLLFIIIYYYLLLLLLFCMTYSLLMLVEDARDHMEEA